MVCVAIDFVSEQFAVFQSDCKSNDIAEHATLNCLAITVVDNTV